MTGGPVLILTSPLCYIGSKAMTTRPIKITTARRLDKEIHHKEDHVLIIDVGPVEKVDPKVESLGKTFATVKRQAIIV